MWLTTKALKCDSSKSLDGNPAPVNAGSRKTEQMRYGEVSDRQRRRVQAWCGCEQRPFRRPQHQRLSNASLFSLSRQKSLPVLSGIDLLHHIQADLFQTGCGSVKVQPSANLPASVSYCLWDLISGVQWLEHSNEIPDDAARLFYIFLVKVVLALTSSIFQD